MNQEYNKSFTFGRVDGTGNGKASNLIELEVTLKLEEGKYNFTASGNLWNAGHTDIIQGGQCIDDMWQEFAHTMTNPTLYKRIMRLWQRNHLNDMHAGCEHQRAEGWGNKELTIEKYTLTIDAIDKRRVIEERSKDDLILIGKAKLNKRERLLLSLSYSVEVPEGKLPANLKPYYKYDSKKTERSGWVYPKDHPEGELTKPCPTCGYKYGTEWKRAEISEEDLKDIKQLLGIK